MSVNQSRGDKNEPPHYRRSGRSVNHASPMNFSGDGGKGGGGDSGSTTAPPSSAFSSGKSFKKVVSNAQGAQTRVTVQNPNPNVNLGSLNSSTGGKAVPNGCHIQPPLRGTPDASSTGVTVKLTDASVQKSSPGLPKVPQSHAVTPISGTTGATGPATPVKGDTSKAFPLQSGSISPGVMNGMQVPARTNSGPPNMDEQKRAQARLDSLKATSFTNPAVPKQQLPRKDVGPGNQKKDVSAPIAAHNQKPTGPPMPSIPGVSMQIPFHQSQIHLPFGGPNPPLQSQNMANTSLPVPLPMHLPVGNLQQVPPQVFVQGIQHHHHQGMIHQSQGLTFSSQIGNTGMPMGLGPQFQQQPTMANLNFGGARRTVKITDPDKRTDGPMQRNNSDSDMWQRATGYQKGLMPSPHIPVMHKAERKYEVGKITDEEQAKQRQLKGILNKLTPQNFEKLFEQVKQVNIDNANTLSDVIGQIFDKALMEPTFVEMYAYFCSQLSVELPDFSEDNEKITFKRLLLNKCQEEFERGVREQEEGEVKQTEEQREEKLVKARRRMLGIIRLIGELYKKKMLTERIMHECIKKLFGQYQDPDEEDIESLCILMSTIGEMIDHPKAKEHMDAYFDFMYTLSNNMQLSSRVRFMLKDAIDLRKNKWQQRRKDKGPKNSSQIHLPFGGPNPPLQSQNMANTSLPVPLPMHLPVGNLQQVPPQVFVQGIQHHHHQGMIHPSQGLTFSSQIGNMGMPMGLGPQFQQQPTMANLNFGGARRTVKITDPDKRTDGLYPNGGSSGDPRSHPQGPSQSQTVPSFPTAHPTNYYPNSYNANPIYFPPHGKQNTPGSQPRFFNQQASKQVTVKPAVSSHGEKVGDSSSAVVKIEIPKSQRIGVEVTSTHPHKNLETITGSSSPAPVEEDATSLVNSETEVAKKATVNSSGSLKEEQKQPSKKAMSIPVEKIDEQSSVVSSSSVGHHRSIDSEVQKASKGKKKIKELLKNAAAARGTTFDLYHAYKRPEKKKETSLADERRGPSKFVSDDWEDVADISFPIMETGFKRHSEDDNGMTKKYSRDFLLKFLDHCTDLPEGFEIDITKVLIASSVNMARELPSAK